MGEVRQDGVRRVHSPLTSPISRLPLGQAPRAPVRALVHQRPHVSFDAQSSIRICRSYSWMPLPIVKYTPAADTAVQPGRRLPSHISHLQ